MGDRGGNVQDLIKDCLCYVISWKRRRPCCCKDGEQLAWGFLIACSDSFQASSFRAHTRNDTDVYCWVLWWTLRTASTAVIWLHLALSLSPFLSGQLHIHNVWTDSAVKARKTPIYRTCKFTADLVHCNFKCMNYSTIIISLSTSVFFYFLILLHVYLFFFVVVLVGCPPKISYIQV